MGQDRRMRTRIAGLPTCSSLLPPLRATSADSSLFSYKHKDTGRGTGIGMFETHGQQPNTIL